MQVEEARPPYISFELRAVEDRQASIEAGHYKTKDEEFVFITPQGSKDRIERIVSEWLANMQEQVVQNRLPASWLAHYRASHAAWKEGTEIPEEGTAILSWPVLSPSQVKTCIDAQVRTVEGLAVANEETIMRLGMGGRALKDKAISWLAAANGNGKVSEKLTALSVKLEATIARNVELEKQVATLTAQAQAAKK